MEGPFVLLWLALELVLALLSVESQPRRKREPPNRKWGVAAERASELWVKGMSDSAVTAVLNRELYCTPTEEAFTERLVRRMKRDMRRETRRR